MSFWIQVGNPQVLSAGSRVCDDISEALQEIFPVDTERALLVWNRSYVPICYKYDLSVLIDDLVPLLSAVLGKQAGEYEVNWGSNTFNARWVLDWRSDELSIASEWNSIVGDIEPFLNSRSSVATTRSAFLWEWKALLERVIGSIQMSGVRIADQAGYDRLRGLADAIDGYGVLYRNAKRE